MTYNQTLTLQFANENVATRFLNAFNNDHRIPQPTRLLGQRTPTYPGFYAPEIAFDEENANLIILRFNRPADSLIQSLAHKTTRMHDLSADRDMAHFHDVLSDLITQHKGRVIAR